MPSEELLAELSSAADDVIGSANSGDQKDEDQDVIGDVVDGSEDTNIDGEDPVLDGKDVDDDGDTSDDSGVDADEDSIEDGVPNEEEGVEQDPEEFDPLDDSDLVDAAIRAGLSFSELRGFKSRESLERVIEIIAERNNDVEQEEEYEDSLAGIPDLDPEEHDEKTIQMFKALKDVAREQQAKINELASGQRQMDDAQYEQASRELMSEFDGFVESLGEDYEAALGKGSTSVIARGSEAHVNRDRVMEQMAVLIHGYNAAGIQRPTRKKIFDMAVSQVLPEVTVEARTKKTKAKLDEQKDLHISRTGTRKQRKSKDPLEEAAAEIDERFGFKK